ncbi:MAG: hypothetical protein VX656_17275 [Candidatus Latescibacterota bacterium]|nr:hypothetical protein [Candidatus Latescibacterota bacterium]MEE3042058.1 hypothetical protein [Candidatus Latescibacterota bacterium]
MKRLSTIVATILISHSMSFGYSLYKYDDGAGNKDRGSYTYPKLSSVTR